MTEQRSGKDRRATRRLPLGAIFWAYILVIALAAGGVWRLQQSTNSANEKFDIQSAEFCQSIKDNRDLIANVIGILVAAASIPEPPNATPAQHEAVLEARKRVAQFQADEQALLDQTPLPESC